MYALFKNMSNQNKNKQKKKERNKAKQTKQKHILHSKVFSFTAFDFFKIPNKL